MSKSSLLTNGFLHLTKQTESDLNDLISSLGEVFYTTDVVVKSESKGLVTSDRGLDFHTDHHKAKFIIWYCIKQTTKGGESILLDAEKVYQQLSYEDQEQLSTIELFEHKLFPDDKESYPLVRTDEKGKRMYYYSFWLVRNSDKTDSALLNFQKAIKTTPFTNLNLEAGDILVIDNHRILHGRTAIEGSKDRFLKRYWIK